MAGDFIVGVEWSWTSVVAFNRLTVVNINRGQFVRIGLT